MDPNTHVVIIGDAFVDLYCFLSDNQSLPSLGGDSRLCQPIHSVAGGSGLNTATHLQHLLDCFQKHDAAATKVELQTVINEEDDYGKLLLKHVDKFGFKLVNCLPKQQAKHHEGSSSSSIINESTGHCAVIVCNNDRSFMTHLGCVGNFHASHINVDCLIAEQQSHSPPLATTPPLYTTYNHIHVAGYYNIPGFWNGSLQNVLASIIKKGCVSDETNSCIKTNQEKEEKAKRTSFTTTTTVSLVPQHDATEKWDGQLLNLLQYVNFLIMNELEALSIVSSHDDTFACWRETSYNKRIKNNNENESGTNDADHDQTLLQKIAVFFQQYNPNMYVIVTRGSKGAVSLRNGVIIHLQKTGRVVESPIDPTGAGDAFAAGFIHGVFLDCTNNKCWDDAVKQGLKWGCAAGTGCVLRQGASNPSTNEEIESMLP